MKCTVRRGLTLIDLVSKRSENGQYFFYLAKCKESEDCEKYIEVTADSRE